MATATCRVCSAQVSEVNGQFRVKSSEKCTELPETTWFDDPGIIYCPNMSDAGTRLGWLLLPPGYRKQVMADIEAAKKARSKADK